MLVEVSRVKVCHELKVRVGFSILAKQCVDVSLFRRPTVPVYFAQQSLAERDAEVSKLRSSITALGVELQRKTVDLGAVQRQVRPNVSLLCNMPVCDTLTAVGSNLRLKL